MYQNITKYVCELTYQFSRFYHNSNELQTRRGVILAPLPPQKKPLKSPPRLGLSNRKQRVVLDGQNSSWANVHVGVPQGSIPGPLLFLIYINDLNDLSDKLTSNATLFSDDTSLFSVVYNITTSAKELNDDLKKVNKQVFQRKMSSNPNPSKQAQEVIFSSKSKRPTHPPLVFDNNKFSQSFSQ